MMSDPAIGSRFNLLWRDGPRAADVQALRDPQEYARQVHNRVSRGARRGEVRNKAVSLLGRRPVEMPSHDARISIQSLKHDRIPL